MRRVWVVVLFFLNFSLMAAFSFEIPLLENWRYTYGDNVVYSHEEYDDNEWMVVQFPTTTFRFEGISVPYTWLRKRFFVPERLKGNRLGLYTGRIHDAVEIYLNGVLIGVSGSQPPQRYFGTPHAPRGFLLPEEVLRYGGTNLLAIRVYTHKTQGAFGEILVAPYQEVLERVHRESFLGLGIPQVVTIVSLFMVLYFLFLFWKNREKTYLFLAIGAFFIGIYYMDIYVEYLPIDYLLKQKIAFSGLYLCFIFFILFFHSFYGFQRKWQEMLAFIFGGGSVIANFLMPDFPMWEMIMGSVVQLVWVLPAVLYILWVNLSAVFQKKTYAFLMFVGAFFAIFFSLRDSFGFILRMWARYWTSSWGMLLFSVSMFISMALRAADIQKESMEKEEKLRKQKGELQEVLEKTEQVVVELGETSQELDREISSARMAMEYVIDLSREMRGEFQREAEKLRESARATALVAGGMGNVMQRLERENQLIQRGMKSFDELVRSIGEMVGELRQLKDVMGGLKEGVLSLGEQTKASQGALEELSGRAENVFVLLGNIQKIADDTNTLAINAAIQSAHAGEYGKSFAIVGQEVRNLALSVARLAETVTSEVQEMNNELSGVQAHFGRLEQEFGRTLKELERVEGLLGVFQERLEKQREGSQNVVMTIQELDKVVGGLLMDLGKQKEDVQEFVRTLEKTEKLLEAFMSKLDSQREKEEKVLQVMESLSGLSQKHKEIVASLTDVVIGKEGRG
ncbi:methyl-accepting chemotaxis protein [Thermospira aquatica]|uniref:Methyl-accepting transducer domain-containing protein n=1 Tax=Thermospira aquatica TaxID=2828656 RepID=A0AAX3BB39_9SPIR|nr:methyl-accepting chemotaxis protein [Thermospira aquatica]URA09512.1 hypothetical protein KDW03_08435 [Thermospira aquatica]